VINQGALGAAAEFEVGDWQMALNPDEFVHREGVETIGQLTADEAGIIAMTVYHEARHAEQHHRLMRLEHGDESEGSGQELAEAREWQGNESGEDATYREAVTSWLFELRDAARLAHGVTDDTAEEAHRKIGSALRGWNKSNAAEPYIRSHLASAKQR